jgi:eukaryotic-like serine/threonine-protein kinase
VTGAADPVAIPGLTFVRTIGSGGHADVHLCTQDLPRRRVAVKVLREPISDAATRAAFESETSVLGALSAHPSIVTIHHAAVTEDGRPYLVMEYCSQGTLADRARQRPLSAPELLQTFIRLSGAVETAHRAGVLHRDIKPANVLTTEYGWPALADFGIAALPGQDSLSGGALSLPWAAPEVVAGAPFDERSDVYSLAATAYTLLAGASPFADPSAPELSGLIARILSAPAPELEREDVPVGLRLLIAQGLAKDPADRPPSASAFARGLQRVEQDMRLPGTHLDVPGSGDPYLIEDGDDGEDTRLARPAGAARAPEEPPAEETRIASRTPVDERTLLSHRAPAPTTPPDDATRISPRTAAAPAESPEDPDDRTRIAHREPATPVAPDEADERTRLTRRDPEPADDRTRIGGRQDDRTRLVSAPAESAARPIAPATGPVGGPGGSGRAAYAPGDAGVAHRAYRARDVAPAAPIVRTPAAAPAPRPPAAPARRRTRRPRVILAVAIGAAVVIVVAIAGAIVLSML